jgi:hypothetical protein
MRPRTLGLCAPCLLLLAAASLADRRDAGPTPPGPSPGGTGVPPVVEDGAHLFSADALAEARQRIDEFRQEHERDLVVETIPSVPGSTWRWWLRMKLRKLTAYAEDEVKKRQKTAGLPAGIYVLICQDPPGVHVTVWPDRDPAWFPQRDQSRISERLTRTLGEESPDLLLQQVLGEIHEALQPPPDPPANPLILVGLMAGLLAAWLILSLLAARASRAAGNGDALPPPSADLRAAWLGSLFGLPATGWIHDRLFRASAPPDAPPDEGDLFASARDAPGSPGHVPETTWKG